MTRMVTAVIPPAAQRPDLNGRSFAVRSKMSLPLLRSTRLGATVYAVAAVDCNGRVAERAAVRAMGWTAGAALTVWIHAGLILVRADEQGGSVVSPAGYVRLPAAMRHRCGLVAGDRLFLAADPERGLLAMYPPATLDAMVTTFQAAALRGDGT